MSLRVGTSSEPGSPDLTSLAGARHFVPRTWWCMFEEADAKRGPYGVVFVVPSALALRRLREAAPAWRAAGGRRVLGLRAIEAGIERFPDGFVHVDLSERYETHTPGAWEWERPGRRRVRKSPVHHGTFEDDLVGMVTNVEALRPAVEALAGSPEDLSTLGRHVEAAVIADDPSQVDLLEEALAIHGACFEAWLPVVRARWKRESPGKLSFPDLSAVVRALASGEADPFAAARAYPPEIAAPALERISRRAMYNMLSRPEQKAFRSALGSSTDPLAAPLALGHSMRSESLLALYVAEWLDDGTPPLGGSTIPILACRLASIGTEEPLSLSDPAAWAERVSDAALTCLGGTEEDLDPQHVELAVRRALLLSRGLVQRWYRERGASSEVDVSSDGGTDGTDVALTLEAKARILCVDAVEGIVQLGREARERLLGIECPDDAFLRGAARACVLLALGRREELETLPLDDATLPIGDAIRATGMDPLPTSTLERRVAVRDFAAAALLLESADCPAALREAARSLLPDAVAEATRWASDVYEGIVSTWERDVMVRRLSSFARAVGPEGAELRLATRVGPSVVSAIAR